MFKYNAQSALMCSLVRTTGSCSEQNESNQYYPNIFRIHFIISIPSMYETLHSPLFLRNPAAGNIIIVNILIAVHY
jgi:hypothetical protein